MRSRTPKSQGSHSSACRTRLTRVPSAGELILTGVAYAADYRGALGKADAPGRVAAAAGVAEAS